MVGEGLGLSAAAVLERIGRFLESGYARRLGGVFDARRLGYRSVLCAVDLPADLLEKTAAAVCQHPGVTHGYERCAAEGQHWPSFWFTLATPQADFDRELEAVRRQVAPHELLTLPALRRFKIDVMFDPRTRDRDERVPAAQASAGIATGPMTEVFTPLDQAMVRALDASLPLVERPFAKIAGELGLPESELLRRLAAWQEQGVLRRVALIVRHRELGFTANGMCVWDVPAEDVMAAGRRVAQVPEVTHCYARPRSDRFPFTLYAMIHTGDAASTRQLFERISRDAGLPDGQLLLSQREFKKTSMAYFV
jgi:DNA-binding Lrp family transcriptional regulator